MYSKEETAKLKQQFWTSFGKYMKPVPGAANEPVNWLNYKTGIRNIYFRMDADKQEARVGIEIRHPQEADRLHYYNQLLDLKKILQQSADFNWQWQPIIQDEYGQAYCAITLSLTGVNVLNQADWPAIIAFLKPRIIGLDAFWQLVKEGFE
ncbi:MAG: hypothetical protein RL172_1052 [Bacteroidota bacterium]|jgi:hypothetical protein